MTTSSNRISIIIVIIVTVCTSPYLCYKIVLDVFRKFLCILMTSFLHLSASHIYIIKNSLSLFCCTLWNFLPKVTIHINSTCLSSIITKAPLLSWCRISKDITECLFISRSNYLATVIWIVEFISTL